MTYDPITHGPLPAAAPAEDGTRGARPISDDDILDSLPDFITMEERKQLLPLLDALDRDFAVLIARAKFLAGVTIVGEGAGMRPASMSHQKATEFAPGAIAILKEITAAAPLLLEEVRRLREELAMMRSSAAMDTTLADAAKDRASAGTPAPTTAGSPTFDELRAEIRSAVASQFGWTVESEAIAFTTYLVCKNAVLRSSSPAGTRPETAPAVSRRDAPGLPCDWAEDFAHENGQYPGTSRDTPWIRFVGAGKSESGKTLVWDVENKDSGFRLGDVRWYSPWRRYAFNPVSHAVFEEDCLRDIANFCEQETQKHKDAARRAAPAAPQPETK